MKLEAVRLRFLEMCERWVGWYVYMRTWDWMGTRVSVGYLADLPQHADVADEDEDDGQEEGQRHLVHVGVQHQVDVQVVPVAEALSVVRHHHHEAEHLADMGTGT